MVTGSTDCLAGAAVSLPRRPVSPMVCTDHPDASGRDVPAESTAGLAIVSQEVLAAGLKLRIEKLRQRLSRGGGRVNAGG